MPSAFIILARRKKTMRWARRQNMRRRHELGGQASLFLMTKKLFVPLACLTERHEINSPNAIVIEGNKISLPQSPGGANLESDGACYGKQNGRGAAKSLPAAQKSEWTDHFGPPGWSSKIPASGFGSSRKPGLLRTRCDTRAAAVQTPPSRWLPFHASRHQKVSKAQFFGDSKIDRNLPNDANEIRLLLQ